VVFTIYTVTLSYNPAENNYEFVHVYITSYDKIIKLPFTEEDHVNCNCLGEEHEQTMANKQSEIVTL
jgi:hypothetical protein